MEISIFFGQLWGWLLVILGLVFLIRSKVFLTELFKLANDETFDLLSGYLALILGLVTVILHNVWVGDWRVIITIFGWLSLVKGIVRVGFPEVTRKLVSVFQNKLIMTRALLVVMVLLGGWLLQASY